MTRIRKERQAKSVLAALHSRILHAVFYLLIILPATCLAQEPWKFIVTCDSRGSDNGIQPIILGELVNEILDQGVDFVLFPGDLVSGYAYIGPEGFEGELWTWVNKMQPVYDAGIGVYVSRGNHELMDTWSRSIWPNVDPDDNHTTRWLNVFGNDLYPELMLPDNGPESEKYMTYAVTHKNAFIISLDHYAGINHETIHMVNQEWLDAQLAANTKPHIFIAGHETAFRAMHTDGLDNRPAERDAFWASIRNAGGRTYFAGHDHFYDHARIDDGDGNPDNDIHQYIIGTGGAYPYAWSPPYSGNNSFYTVEQLSHFENYGYVLVEVYGLDVTLTWMGRHTMDLGIPGIYQPGDFWNYSVSPGPIVLSPNGGENLSAASSHNIAWKTQEPAEIDTVKIEYSSDNGQTFQTIDTVINTGLYTWDPLAVVDSNQCLIRISDTLDFAVSDTSDETFTIFQCSKQLKGDLNGDCYVNFLDIAILAGDWLECGNPFDASCD
ncbi:MAG: metallophosphoesterase family protein [Planctomycetota bacterium]